jgi:putative protein kinase ArgK-like GTPase of G3E family
MIDDGGDAGTAGAGREPAAIYAISAVDGRGLERLSMELMQFLECWRQQLADDEDAAERERALEAQIAADVLQHSLERQASRRAARNQAQNDNDEHDDDDDDEATVIYRDH